MCLRSLIPLFLLLLPLNNPCLLAMPIQPEGKACESMNGKGDMPAGHAVPYGMDCFFSQCARSQAPSIVVSQSCWLLDPMASPPLTLLTFPGLDAVQSIFHPPEF
jgi:hypothetical protein